MVEFRANTLWFSGPKVTFESADCDTTEMPEECLKEMKVVSKSFKTNEGHDQQQVHVVPPTNTECVLIASESIGTDEVQGIEQLIDLREYSNLDFVLRVTANILKTMARFKRAEYKTDVELL